MIDAKISAGRNLKLVRLSCGIALVGLFMGALLEWENTRSLHWGMSRQAQIVAASLYAWGLLTPANFCYFFFERFFGHWRIYSKFPKSRGGPFALASVAIVLGFASWRFPATVFLLVLFSLIFSSLLNNLDQNERSLLRWFLIASAGLRLLAIFVYFPIATHMGWTASWNTLDISAYEVPVLFGDGADAILYSRAKATFWRGFWIPTSDLFEVFNPERSFVGIHGDVRHLLPQTIIFFLFGVEPVAARVLSAMIAVLSAFLAFTILRDNFGKQAAWIGITLVSFWPTLLIWSIDALKEPYYLLLVMMAAFFCARFAKNRRWYDLLYSLAVFAMALSIRTRFYPALYGTVALSLGGYLIHRGFHHWRPTRRIFGGFLILALLVGMTLTLSPTRQILVENTYRSYTAHLSFSESPSGYQVWPKFYYTDIAKMEEPDRRKAFSVKDWPGAWVRNLGHVLFEPFPKGESNPLKISLAFGWWLMILLAAVGTCTVAARRSGVGWIFITYVFLIFAFLAMFSGNAGTLIRQRDMATPLLLILSAIGAVKCKGLFRIR